MTASVTAVPRSDAILARLLALHPKKIDLVLDRMLRLIPSQHIRAQPPLGDPCLGRRLQYQRGASLEYPKLGRVDSVPVGPAAGLK